jgi:hypothetical protein
LHGRRVCGWLVAGWLAVVSEPTTTESSAEALTPVDAVETFYHHIDVHLSWGDWFRVLCGKTVHVFLRHRVWSRGRSITGDPATSYAYVDSIRPRRSVGRYEVAEAAEAPR